MNSKERILQRLGLLHPKGIDLSLDRIKTLLGDLGNPHLSLKKVIHVAGTNGKGSTIAFLKAFLKQAGYSVDTYTSPHLVHFNERICLNGTDISDSLLETYLTKVERINQGRSITFFEATTAAAFLAFADTQSDFVLLETGLGGRLDATNVIEKPIMTLITSLSMDHEEYLGHTLPEIASEKAGIFKYKCPVFALNSDELALAVLRQKAVEKECCFEVEGQEWQITSADKGFYYNDIFFDRPFLLGTHQYHNAGLAIRAIKHLFPCFAKMSFDQGLQNVRWAGRLEQRNDPLVQKPWELWLDGGHNAGAGQALGDFLKQWSDQPLHLICGMLASKDVMGFLKPIAPFVTTFQAVPVPFGTVLSIAPDQLVVSASNLGILTLDSFQTVEEAIKNLVQSKYACGRILVCGSLYLLGHFLSQRTL